MARGEGGRAARELEELLAALERGDPGEQRAAMGALEALAVGQARRRAVAGIDARLRRASGPADLALAVALARLGAPTDRAVDTLLRWLGASHPDARWAARKALARIGGGSPRVAVALAERARSGGPVERGMALGTLAELGWPAAAGDAGSLLDEAIDDPDPGLRVAALTLVVRGVPGGAGLAAAVRARLGEDPDLRVRRVAAVALGEVGGGEDRMPLERAAADTDRGLAAAAHRALSRLAARAI